MGGGVALAYAIAGAIGAAAAFAELVARYRDAPWEAAQSRGGVLYIGFNAAVSLGAMFLIRNVFPIPDWTGTPPGPPVDPAGLAQQVLIAGVGAMAVLRSAIITVRSGDQDVAIGPAAIVEVLRIALDRDVDRVRAGPRSVEVQRIMAGVSFARAYEPLTSISISLLQNVKADEEAQLRQRIAALANETGRSDADKALELGLILAGSVGFPVLEKAKALLGDRISDGVKRPVLVVELLADMSFDTIARDLPAIALALNTSVSPEDQTLLSGQIDSIIKSALSEGAKVVNIGLVIANVLGDETLRNAVGLLKHDMTEADGQ